MFPRLTECDLLCYTITYTSILCNKHAVSHPASVLLVCAHMCVVIVTVGRLSVMLLFVTEWGDCPSPGVCQSQRENKAGRAQEERSGSTPSGNPSEAAYKGW